jgi:hypothetical protein
MPGFDGTGPLGQGPMTGRGLGFCVLTNPEETQGQVKGFAGLHGTPISQKGKYSENTGKEVINMPFGDGTGPAGAGPMTGRAAGFCAGYPVPGYMNPAGSAGWVNPAAGRAGFYDPGVPAFAPYGAGLYGYSAGYGMPYAGWGNPWLPPSAVLQGTGRRGFGFGFGRGFGRGRGWGRGRRFW